MAGHGVYVHRFENGEVGLCTGTLKPFPLFLRPNITDMVEVLRQMSLQAQQIENQPSRKDVFR